MLMSLGRWVLIAIFAPDADVEAANTDSFFENSSQKGTMSDDDDDLVIPKGIAHYYIPSKMVYLKLEENTAELY